MMHTVGQQSRGLALLWAVASWTGVGVILLLVSAPRPAAAQGGAAWDSVAAVIESVATRERAAHNIPGTWWAVVDARGITRLGAAGHAVRDSAREATPDDRVRAGTLTGLVTTITLLRQAARFGHDLDAPIAGFHLAAQLPDAVRSITVRALLAQRAPLHRELSVGHAYDTSDVPLDRAVASIAQVPQPRAALRRADFPSANVAVIARLLALDRGRPIDEQVQTELLDPLGMTRSDFNAPDGPLAAHGEGWTIAGPPEPASRARASSASVVGLNTTVRDLAQLALAIVRRGRVSDQVQIGLPRHIDSLWIGDAIAPRSTTRIGLGFAVEGQGPEMRAWRDGLAPGFASTIRVAPADSVAVVVFANSSAATASVARIADDALRLARAAHARRAIAAVAVSAVAEAQPVRHAERAPPLAPAALQPFLGFYANGLLEMVVAEDHGHPLLATNAGRRMRATLQGDTLRIEQGGAFGGETLVAERDANGRVSKLTLGGLRLARRALGPESGNQLKVAAVRPIAELRAEAMAASPPPEAGRDAKVELTELTHLDPSIKLEVRYATDNNLYGTPFYSQARAFLQRPAAEAVVRVHKQLAAFGLGVLIHDGYRPWYVTKMFWDGAGPAEKRFVADPAQGSKHNRGAAVDLSLFDRKTGATVPMVSTYDETSARAYPDWPGGTARERWARELLRRLMEREGFAVYEYEWWHFDYTGWQHWPILNVPFEKLGPPEPDRR